MTAVVDYPLVHAAVGLLVHEDRILAVWNARWGAFTLPMTRRRMARGPQVRPDSQRIETPLEAGYRVFAEVLGTTLTEEPDELPWPKDVPRGAYLQSDADGQWKRYDFATTRIRFRHRPSLAAAVVGQWLTCGELEDTNRHPISPTLRHLLPLLRAAAMENGQAFP